jgi:uncharacterized glyoxalase superfamily protein PhnB
MQTITPYLLYEDVSAAIDWLSRAFGFEERVRFADDTGTVTHAELTHGDGEIFLGNPGPDYRSPKALGTYTDLTHVYVEDVDAHCERARTAGARILRGPLDEFYGRIYAATDLEGHRWMFHQLPRD